MGRKKIEQQERNSNSTKYHYEKVIIFYSTIYVDSGHQLHTNSNCQYNYITARDYE